MSEYEQYYSEYVRVRSRWSHPDSEMCGCKGKGYWLSEVDTWEQCSYHGKDKPHPEEG